jgi:hypothetical protein
VFPLAKLALEAHALRNLEARDHASLDLLAGLSGGFARSPVRPPPWTDKGEKQNGRARRVPIEVGRVAFRESPWPVVSDRLAPFGSLSSENTFANMGGNRRTLYDLQL